MDPYRRDPFSDDDYDDGQWHRLVPGSPLDTAIRNEPWINHSARSRRRWIRLMDNPSTTFVGTILSEPRHQLQLMVLLQTDEVPDRKWMAETIISLYHFRRFL